MDALGLLWMGLASEKKCLLWASACESTSEESRSPAAARIREQAAAKVGGAAAAAAAAWGRSPRKESVKLNHLPLTGQQVRFSPC